MAKERETELVPPVLDRLIDLEPDSPRELPLSAHQQLVQLRQSVHRNLEELLNTAVRSTSWPPGLTELERSLANFGIPDISAAQLQSQQQRRDYLRELEYRIQLFEPRLQQVRVVPVENVNYLDRRLRFRIDATLLAGDVREPIVFDSQLDPAEGTITLQGGR